MKKTHFILYVSDQRKSTDFYTQLLQQEPILNVPGMTEFELNAVTKLGLMPETSISKIIGDKLPHPSNGNGIPRCEIYLFVKNPTDYYQRAVDLGGKAINPVQKRDWGHSVGYVADLDGHVLAFAAAEGD